MKRGKESFKSAKIVLKLFRKRPIRKYQQDAGETKPKRRIQTMFNKKSQIKKAVSSITKENVLATLAYFTVMGVDANYGRYTITDGHSVFGARQVARTMVELHGVSLKDCGLFLPKVVALLNSIGVSVTDHGPKADRDSSETVTAPKASAAPSKDLDAADQLAAIIRAMIAEGVRKQA